MAGPGFELLLVLTPLAKCPGAPPQRGTPASRYPQGCSASQRVPCCTGCRFSPLRGGLLLTLRGGSGQASITLSSPMGEKSSPSIAQE